MHLATAAATACTFGAEPQTVEPKNYKVSDCMGHWIPHTNTSSWSLEIGQIFHICSNNFALNMP